MQICRCVISLVFFVSLFSSLTLCGETVDKMTAFRFRSDFNVELNKNSGWQKEVNSPAVVAVDTPFRLRFEVESTGSKNARKFSLEYRKNKGRWQKMNYEDFPKPDKSPVLSIVKAGSAYSNEEKAGDLLKVSTLPNKDGFGISGKKSSPEWTPKAKGSSGEFEWALVVRHWSDGAIQTVDGDSFSIRMVDQNGRPLSGRQVNFSVRVPENHLGGTFVETPSRLGPFENSKGHLYFIMEPAETDNQFMMVKSSDGGKKWSAVNLKNSPKKSDLESVAGVIDANGVIHISHQANRKTYYHSFATSDHPETPDKWVETDKLIVTLKSKPIPQSTDIVLRPDGSLVVTYATEKKIGFIIRNSDGSWNKNQILDKLTKATLVNPMMVCRPDGTVDIAYKTFSGKGLFRQLKMDNTLTEIETFASGLGSSEKEAASILPLIHKASNNTTYLFFRNSADGLLYCCSKSGKDTWSSPIPVTDRAVVINAVDSDQTGADVVLHKDTFIIGFIDSSEQNIYVAQAKDFKTRPKSKRVITNITGQWIRGSILLKQTDSPVYGFIYDAGSFGGSGFNKFFKNTLSQEE